MADQLQLRGGTTVEHSTFTGALKEVTVDTTKKTIVVHDNATVGGIPLAKENLSNVPAGTITSTMIADGTIATADLADSSVTSIKIADGTIVNADINAAAAIDLSKLATGALPTSITVSGTNIVDLTVATADIADSAVTSAKIADGTIVNADISTTAAIALSKLATGALPSAITVNSSNIEDLSIVTADLADSAVTSAKIADGTIINGDINANAAIDLGKLAVGALPSGITVASTNIVDGTIVNADINAAAAIAGTKISPDFGTQNRTSTGTSTAASFIPSSSTLPTNGLYLPGTNNIGLATNSLKRLDIDSSGYLTGITNGLGNGRIPAMQYYRLDSNFTGSTTAGSLQSFLNVGVTLIGSTTYEFEGVFALNRASGTTGGTLSLGFGGTATANNILYQATLMFGQSGTFISGAGGFVLGYATTMAATSTNNNVTSNNQVFIIKGTISVNAGGTFIPSYQLGTSPSVAFNTVAGSYFRIFPLGASGAATSIGTWA